MNDQRPRTAHAQGTETPGFAALFTPKLVTVLREGYGLAQLRADAVAGLTVAIVALPLSMAIAIASGATPAQGLYTAIVGGFLVSALGGSRFQIGGPAGAFIVLVAATVAQHGMDGLILATFLSGLMLAAVGFLRLGTFIKFIPFPVTVGFTAGIAVIIASSQIGDFLGLKAGKVPAEFLGKWESYLAAIGTVSWPTLAVGGGSLALILLLRRISPRLPGYLIAVAAASAAVALLDLPVETVGARFPAMPLLKSCRWRPLAPVSAASPRPCRCPRCPRFRPNGLSRSFPPPFPSPCSAPSNRFCPPWSQTG